MGDHTIVGALESRCDQSHVPESLARLPEEDVYFDLLKLCRSGLEESAR
jgi:hypothetical protein